jgi:cytochrome c
MKKTSIVLAIAFLCYACGGNEQATETKPISAATETEESQKEKTTEVKELPKDGKALLEASDCRTCHKDKEKLIGPAYAEVAKKYKSTEENITMLASKVINGGTGVWGQIPMSPHNGLSQEDAEAMVTYILTIK